MNSYRLFRNFVIKESVLELNFLLESSLKSDCNWIEIAFCIGSSFNFLIWRLLLQFFIHIRHFWYICTYKSQIFDIHYSFLIYITNFWYIYILTLSDIYYKFLIYINTFWYILQIFDIYWNFLIYITNFLCILQMFHTSYTMFDTYLHIFLHNKVLHFSDVAWNTSLTFELKLNLEIRTTNLS